MRFPACCRAWALLILVQVASGGDSNLFGAQPLPGLSTVTHTFRLADEKVWVHIYESASPGLTFVSLHDDENTATEAAKRYIQQHGGRLVELRHGRGRNVAIRRDGRLSWFDPNRMFTKVGLGKSLERFQSLTETNLILAYHFGQEVAGLVGIERDRLIVAVHNNTEDKLTIQDYRKGELYGANTQEVYANPRHDPDDYFYVTSPGLFSALVQLRYNVALMEPEPSIDTGSLAYFSKLQGTHYVLVEAQHDHDKEQLQMLESLGLLLGGGLPGGN